jgi:uncharacterized protein (TIGR02117 family)
MKQATHERSAPRGLLGQCVRLFLRAARIAASVLTLYLVIVLLGLLPVNNDFEQAPEGIEIFLVSSPIHADVVLPIETDTINWRERFPADCFSGDTSAATHVAVGWGDRGFFVETPTWADVRMSVVAQALFWPSDTCMHVSLTRADFLADDARSVRISVAQYEQLVEYITASFQRTADGSVIQLDDASYGPHDAFFRAEGTYHCLNTCNCWTGRAMQAAGIRTGWLTPLPKTVYLYLPQPADPP